jgi:uncharacterized DUF497 family protein
MHNVDGFEWDPAKDAANRAKHGIPFVEAASAFLDDRGMIIADPDHSHAEDRFVLLGMSGRARLLVVVHCWRRDDSTIRIISARQAVAAEARQYLRRR